MNNIRAYLACCAIVLIWSGWITISRHGVHTLLQPADITLLRYCTAFVAILPLALRHSWRKFRLHQYLAVGLGVGFPYTMASFYGLRDLKAAHAGVLVNGMLPVFGAVAAWFLLRQRVSALRWLAIILIFLANFTMAGGDTFAAGHWLGIALLLTAAAAYTMHMISVKLWQVEWQEALVMVATVNALLFLPLWFLLPHALLQAPPLEIVSQALYQGILVNIIALMFSTYAIKHLGTVTVSIFMSAVPVSTAVLAWLLLGEGLGRFELAGIAGCSLGLLLYSQSQLVETRKRLLT